MDVAHSCPLSRQAHNPHFGAERRCYGVLLQMQDRWATPFPRTGGSLRAWVWYHIGIPPVKERKPRPCTQCTTIIVDSTIDVYIVGVGLVLSWRRPSTSTWPR